MTVIEDNTRCPSIDELSDYVSNISQNTFWKRTEMAYDRC